jgi:Thiamine pyrophosphate-requiring enzymes [acetolactate synthase, pyruvate dehydrogenase (cytochrome), glyoxylate carboligase, phosphonopyruvate decarboxylase]
VLIDLPKDVLTEHLHLQNLPDPVPADAPLAPPPDTVRTAVAWIDQAQRPLLYLGGGVRLAGAEAQAQRLSRRAGLPAVLTLMGLGALPADDVLNLGMLGMHGTPLANHAVDDCDLLIAVGARFDDRATGQLSRFAPRARVIHIDVDARELGKLRHPDLAIQGDARLTLAAIADAVRPRHRSAWRGHSKPCANGTQCRPTSPWTCCNPRS